MGKQVEVGSKVAFSTRRGPREGVVTKLRWKTRKGKARQLAELVTGDPTSLDRMVAEIAGNDGAVWTVDLTSVKVVEQAEREERAAAVAQVANVRNKRAEHKMNRREGNLDVAHARGLDRLSIGAKILVQFRDGPQRCTFRGLVAGSGRVRFDHYGHERFTEAKFVTVVAE